MRYDAMPVSKHAVYKSSIHEGVTVVATQEQQELTLLQGIVRSVRPAVIVELGTFVGGLTLALHEVAPQTPLYTFDRTLANSGEYVTMGPVGSHHYRREWYGPAVKFCPGDLLGKMILPRLAEALVLPGKKLVLCDNGSKVKEFKMCAPLLSAGDIIGVHDWPFEIRMADIEDSLVGLGPFIWDECENANPAVSWRFWRRGP